MNLTRSREYTVNMGNYESVKIGASVTVDTDQLVIAEGTSPQEAGIAFAEQVLEQALAADVKEASELTATRDSFILSWGKGQ